MLSDAILTLRSLVVEEVFLRIACIGTEVVSGEPTDFQVFTIG